MKHKSKLILLVGAVFFLISGLAKADQFYITVNLRCDQSKPELKISFKGAWNERGAQMISIHNENIWNTWDLVSITVDKNEKYKIEEKPVSRICLMEGKQYLINIAPMMAPNFHPEGNCASRMGAQVKVFLNSKELASRGVDGCTETGMVAKSILVRPSKAVIYSEVPAKEFYADK